MKSRKLTSLGTKLFVTAFVVMLGLGLTVVPKALADDRFVVIGPTFYPVEHDGSGPYILVDGNKYYLQADENDQLVVVDGQAYNVLNHHYSDYYRYHNRYGYYHYPNGNWRY